MAATRSAGVRRLMREAAELANPTDMYTARPLEDNLFEWHFTIRGPPDSAFEGGIYHGRIILPHEYPMKPPQFSMLTPTGRFETHTKICLSISAYHPETWLPSWSIGTALTALIAFMTTPGKGALGSLDCSDEQRKKLAKDSLNWKCSECGCTMKDIFHIMEEQAAQKPKTADSKTEEAIVKSSNDTTLTDSDKVVSQAPTNTTENPPPEIAPQVKAVEKTAVQPSITASTNDTVIRAKATRSTATQQQPAIASSSSTTGLLIFIFSAIFFALLFRRLNSMQ